MNKKEFLEELEKRLQALPKEEIQERLQFYSEAIDDRVEEGETEEQAIEEIGTLDEITWEIVKKTPLVTLVKEKVKPKRKMRAWEIVLLCVSFPIWLPLLITAMVLVLVGYILVWVLVIVTYSVEMATASAGCHILQWRSLVRIRYGGSWCDVLRLCFIMGLRLYWCDKSINLLN